MKKQFIFLLIFTFSLCACGKSGYLSEEEHNRVLHTLQHVKDAKIQFAEKTKWSAQVGIKVLEDIHKLIEQYSEKVPDGHKTECAKEINNWQKKMLKAMSFGKNMNVKPFFDAVDSALDQSIHLLEMMIEWDK